MSIIHVVLKTALRDGQGLEVRWSENISGIEGSHLIPLHLLWHAMWCDTRCLIFHCLYPFSEPFWLTKVVLYFEICLIIHNFVPHHSCLRCSSTRKICRSVRDSYHITFYNLGWCLIKNLVLQTNDLRTVHRGVKFSCRFTVQEIQQRWYALLYDSAISRLAITSMRNLHPEVIASVRSKALYSKQEEELLATVKPVSYIYKTNKLNDK